jgi:lipopolysaccharide transport system ATP-binding protein
LKLISRIIEPTSGRISVNGSIGALLELGAGFHSDLTGRENIYLNGSFLGFTRADMDRILDDILSFSEIGKFIDIPIKHYSSGMRMRLGFAIAIHMRPEILLVDEVLAVGDKSFQLRCLDKIYELKRQGIAIVFVTHALASVQEMCDRAIWLDGGQIQADGPVGSVVDEYLAQTYAKDEEYLMIAQSADEEDESDADTDSFQRWGSREAEIVQVQFLDDRDQERRIFKTGDTFVVRMHFEAKERIEEPQFGLAIHHSNGFHINGPNTVFAGLDIEAIEGEGSVDYVVEHLPLLEGAYQLTASIYNLDGTHAYDHHHQAYTFRVRANSDVEEKYGTFLIPSTWRLDIQGNQS